MRRTLTRLPQTPLPSSLPAPYADFLALIHKLQSTIDTVNGILDTVKDKEGADTAATRLPELFETMMAIMEKGRSMEQAPIEGTPDMEVLEEHLDSSISLMEMKLMDIAEQKVYGSEAFGRVLDSLFHE